MATPIIASPRPGDTMAKSMVLAIDWRRVESDHPGIQVRAVDFLGEGWTSQALERHLEA
jgi:hypothetical protein